MSRLLANAFRRSLPSHSLHPRSSHPHLSFSRVYTSALQPSQYQQVIQQAQPFVKSLLFRWTAVKVGVLLLGSVSLSAAYVVVAHQMDEKKMKDTLVKGTCPSINVDNADFVHRPSVESDFVRMVTPSEKPASYFVVVGEHGTGKSTMIKAACSKVGGGVIYVDVPSKVECFGNIFARAIGLNFHLSSALYDFLYKKIHGVSPAPTHVKWEVPFAKFEELAAFYRKKTGKVPVLVIDNANFLAKDDEKCLEELQRYAKTAIDDKLFMAIFVSSDGLAPTQLKGRSSFSRGKLYRVGDLDDNQVKEFLTKRKIDSAVVQDQVRNLVGGRVLLLSKVCEELNAGVPFERVRDDLMAEVEDNLKPIIVSHKRLWESIRSIATSKPVFDVEDCLVTKEGEVEDEAYQEEFSKMHVMLEALVKANIFSKVTGGYTFHSNVERAYCLKP